MVDRLRRNDDITRPAVSEVASPWSTALEDGCRLFGQTPPKYSADLVAGSADSPGFPGELLLNRESRLQFHITGSGANFDLAARIYPAVERSNGRGPLHGLVVGVHGLGCDTTYFDRVIEDPALKGKFPFLLVDLPGHGENWQPSANNQTDLAACTVLGAARALRAVLNVLNVNDVRGMGHSLGAAIITAAGIERPLSIAGRIHQDCQNSKALAEMPGPDEIRDYFTRLIANRKELPERKVWAQTCLRSDPLALRAFAGDLVRWTLSDPAAQVGEKPASQQSLSPIAKMFDALEGLHLYGANDAGEPSWTRNFRRLSGGHFPMSDAPDELVAAISAWLRQ